MFRRSLAPIAVFMVILSTCGLWSVIQTYYAALPPRKAFRLYTDAQAQVFAGRLDAAGFGAQQHPPGLSADTVLEQVGVDLQRLPLLGRNVGNCLDVSLYALSPRYQLWIDDNACFGTGIEVVNH